MNKLVKYIVIAVTVLSIGSVVTVTSDNTVNVHAAKITWYSTKKYKHINKNVEIINKSKKIYDVYGSVVGKNKPVYIKAKFKSSDFTHLHIDSQMTIGGAIYYHFRDSKGNFGWIWHGYTRDSNEHWLSTKNYKRLNKQVTIKKQYGNKKAFNLLGTKVGSNQDGYFKAWSQLNKLGILNVDSQMIINGAIYYHFSNGNAWVWHGYTADKKSGKKSSVVTSKVLGVKYISQEAAGAPMGCEAASTLEALHYKGKAKSYDLKHFIKTMPVAKNGNPYKGFGGTPFRVTYGIYQSIFPSALTPWVQRFSNAKNISGTNEQGIINEIKAGNPVVSWITLNYRTAVWDKYNWGYGVDNAHVVTVDGYNNNSFHIVDPENGVYWISKASFMRSYNYMKFAVSVR